jgi:hypothetical protein
MSLTMPKKGAGSGDFELTPAGTHVATCYRVIDLGTQETKFEGKVNHKHQVMVSWELNEEKMKDGKPFAAHKTYTFSFHEKSNLLKDLESWRGRPFRDDEWGTFSLKKLLTVPCMLTIVHESKRDDTYANIRAVASLPKGMKDENGKPKVPPLVNELVYLELSNFDRAVYEKLSDKLKEKIAKSPEYQALMGNDPRQEDQSREEDQGGGDDIPF